MFAIHAKKRKLAVELGHEEVRMLLARGEKVERYQVFPLGGFSLAGLDSQLKNFKGRKKSEVILVIPRSSVIERQFELEPDGEELHEAFLEKIRQTMPVSLDEVSYGMKIQKKGRGISGILLATPLRSLNEMLKILNQAGIFPDEIVSSDQALFQVAQREERLLPTPKGVPPDLYGAALLEGHSIISLLPREKKIEKREKEKKRLLRDTGILFMVLLFLVFFGVSLHRYRETDHLKRLDNELARLKPEIMKLEKVISTLEIFHQYAESNLLLLRLMKEMSQSVPGEVVLEGLAWDKTGIRLRGTSPSYSGVVGTTQSLAKAGLLESPHLEYARLREKESRDFFEFEVSADRKEENPRRGESLWAGPSTQERLAKAQALLRSKYLYLKDYESFKKAAPEFFSSSDLMNDWVRELVAALESHGFKVNQLQPQGMEDKGNYKSGAVKILFAGELKGLIAFLYRFISPNSGVLAERLVISREKSQKPDLTYEAQFSKLFL